MGLLNPGDKTREEVTHYYGDGCVPPHIDPTLPSQEAGQEMVASAVIPPLATEAPAPPPPASGKRPAQETSKDGRTVTYRDQARSILSFHAGLEDNDHGADTPQRFLDMLTELTWHKHCNGDCIKFRTFPNDGMDEMIVVQGIPFVSVCNHHIVPFIGHAHVAYVPKDKIIGLSKFARVVDHFARALQVQERLTAQVADYLEEHLSPRGVGVVLQAEHLCYDDQTEILTEDGWTHFKHLRPEQLVAQVDVSTGIGTFVVPSNYVAYRYVGPMMLGESYKTSTLVTPDHRIYYKTAQRYPIVNRQWMVKQAKDVWSLKSRIVLPRTASFASGTIHNPDWARFLGIWSADGCTTTQDGKPLVVISQNPGSTASEIKALLDRLQYHYYIGKTSTGCLQFRIRETWLYEHLRPFKNSVDRQGPREVLSMTQECIEEFIAWHRKGDGDHQNSSLAAQEAHYSTSKVLIDFLQECLIRTGRAGNVRQWYYDGCLRYILRPSKVDTTSLRPQDRSIVDYDGEVYCVSVPTGAIMVRRNGTPLVSGNCMTIRGVQKPGALTTTAAMKGVFSQHERTAKAEFMRYLNGGH